MLRLRLLGLEEEVMKNRRAPRDGSRDFLGVPFKVGDYVAAGGSGNRSAEYGMILYKVLDVEDKPKLIRLTVSYPTHGKDNSIVIKTAKVTVQNTNKYVVVRPPDAVVDLFERALAGIISLEEAHIIGWWVHGQKIDLFREEP